MDEKLDRWLSLSTDPFKSRHAQLSAIRRHVSTNPVLAPLAAESLCPCGSAR
jgi:hypothetical protein